MWVVLEGILTVVLIALLIVFGAVALVFVLAAWLLFLAVASLVSIPLMIVSVIGSFFTPRGTSDTNK